MTNARLSDTEYEIMSLLAEKPTYGLDLVERSDGQIKKGTVYVLLGRLEERDFVHGEYRINGDAIPRRFYTLTTTGKDVYDLWKKLKKAVA